MRRGALILAAVVALLAPAGAAAQSTSPFSSTPLPDVQSDPQPAVTVSSSSTGDDDGGLASWQEVLIVAAGGLLLVGIGWLIVGDARRRAPAGPPGPEQEATRVRREEDLRRRKERSRAATKRSRQARKRNR
jgi:hypothetical protein